MNRPKKSFLPSSLQSDLLSGFQVFLIALPLCIGISIASGFPPTAGLVAAIVGGLIVSRISGSHVTINGPAAGLIVVILAGVERLGHGDPVAGYPLTLAAIAVAGVIQIVFGLIRAGRLATLFPGAAVHGMLAAIGIIILAKQLPVMLGAAPAAKSVFGLLAEIPQLILHADPKVAVVGFVSLAILIVHPFVQHRVIKKIPAPIWVVVSAALMAHALDFHANPKLLVNIPQNVVASLGFPDFSRALSYDFCVVVASIALIASLESLLSAAAVDRLDPEQRKSDLNKDILAIGVGTTISALCGGLPMIAEIVRSKANVDNGGRTGWANFFHGICLLAAVLLFPAALRYIPLSALAALLVFTGYRLGSPAELFKMKKVGWDQLTIFLTTIIVTLQTDLLIGIASGVGMKVLLHLVRRVSIKDMVRCQFDLAHQGERQYVMRVSSALVFTNLAAVVGAIEGVPRDARLVMDLTAADFIDHTAMERIHEVARERATAGGAVEILESEHHAPVSSHMLAARRLRLPGRA